ncbi:MAG: hypothetical protein ACOYMA_07705 [Bacteroidia bacterium]
MEITKDQKFLIKSIVIVIAFFTLATIAWDHFIIKPRLEEVTSKEITSFDDLKPLLIGSWVSKEELNSLHSEFFTFEFNSNGTIKFKTGIDDNPPEILSTGTWSIIVLDEGVNYVNKNNRFFIEIKFQTIHLLERFVVEIDPVNPKIWRSVTENDLTKERLGLFSFGGKYFYKK